MIRHYLNIGIKWPLSEVISVWFLYYSASRKIKSLWTEMALENASLNISMPIEFDNYTSGTYNYYVKLYYKIKYYYIKLI